MFSSLIIALVWPEPEASAAGSHMMDLIRALQPISTKLTFACTAGPSKHAVDLNALGIDVVEIKVNHASFDDFIRDLEPDVVVFDRFMTEEQFSWRVRQYCPSALRILNTEDLHGLRRSRELEIMDQSSGRSENPLINAVMKREIAALFRSDLSLIISTDEIEFLRDYFSFKSDQLHYFPLLADDRDDTESNSLPSFEDRSGFVTIGNFKHPPNQDAVLLLKREIWPKIRKAIPGAELRIFGSYMGDKWKQLHNEDEGFLMMGHAESVNEVLGPAKLLLAPLRFGAGLKGKLLDAMSIGTPFVTMSHGIEGFVKDGLQPGLVADTIAEFIDSTIELYNDKVRWGRCQEEGFRLINSHFRKEPHLNSLSERIAKAADQIEELRRHNLTGEVFWHSSLMSSKYMSRWIELKNSKKNSDPE